MQRPLSIANRRHWRAWLVRNHAMHPPVWVRLYKKQVGKGMTYEAAVEEALCFGWIDGQLRRIDAQRHALRFSPRRPDSVWAPSNIARIKRLIREKRMTPAGLAIYRQAKPTNANTAPVVTQPKSTRLPADLERALRQRPIALRHFQSYPKSFRAMAIWWVKSAKQGATRLRRIRNIVANAARFARPQY